jgi:hypothetical protein
MPAKHAGAVWLAAGPCGPSAFKHLRFCRHAMELLAFGRGDARPGGAACFDGESTASATCERAAGSVDGGRENLRCLKLQLRLTLANRANRRQVFTDSGDAPRRASQVRERTTHATRCTAGIRLG